MNKYFSHIENLLEEGCEYSDLVVQLMEKFSIPRNKADDYLELYFEQNEIEENTNSSFREEEDLQSEGEEIIEKGRIALLNQDKVLNGVRHKINEERTTEKEKVNYSLDEISSFVLQIPRARHLLNECIDGKKKPEDVIPSITEYILQNFDVS